LVVDPVGHDLCRAGGRPVDAVGLQAQFCTAAAGLGGGGLFADQAQDEVDLPKGFLSAT